VVDHLSRPIITYRFKRHT